MKILVNSQSKELGVVDLPIWPSKQNFEHYKTLYPTEIVEIDLLRSGERCLLKIKTLTFVSGMNLPPRKKGWI